MAAATGNDGCNATATHLSNLHVTPVEIIESEYPCRITEFDMVPDSGGAGEYRGGVAFRRKYQVLQDCTVVRRYDRYKYPPPGTRAETQAAPANSSSRPAPRKKR